MSEQRSQIAAACRQRTFASIKFLFKPSPGIKFAGTLRHSVSFRVGADVHRAPASHCALYPEGSNFFIMTLVGLQNTTNTRDQMFI
jgi:hypothetical protein